MGAPYFDGSQLGPPLGYFTYYVAEDRWNWSDGLYELHGFTPHEVPPTTGVLLSHKHPDDRLRAYEVLEAAVKGGEPFSCYHRIIDRYQRVRSVLSVGRAVKDGDGVVVKIVGFFIDMTEVRRAETNAGVEEALAQIAAHRAVIEQAKGMVMLATGCTADDAFALLRKSSQNANVKLHEVAHRLVDAVAATRLRASEETGGSVTGFLCALG